MSFKRTLAALLCLCAFCCGAAWAEEGYSQDVAKAVRLFMTDFMTDGARAFTFDKKEGVFRATLNAGGDLRMLGCLIVVGEGYFRSYIVSPIGADPGDPAKLAAMSEFICRVNYGMRNGNFELDYSDGEIRYKSFVDCSGGITPSRDIIENSVIAGIEMTKRYFPGIKAVLFNGVSPKEAIEKCEK